MNHHLSKNIHNGNGDSLEKQGPGTRNTSAACAPHFHHRGHSSAAKHQHKQGVSVTGQSHGLPKPPRKGWTPCTTSKCAPCILADEDVDGHDMMDMMEPVSLQGKGPDHSEQPLNSEIQLSLQM